MKSKIIKTKCDCGHIAKSNGISTGYGTDREGKKICFKCCGKQDEKELISTGKLIGYYSNGYFTNWPGTFKIKSYYERKSFHNMAGRNGRTDFWFTYKGLKYWGVQIGKYSEIARIKRVK